MPSFSEMLCSDKADKTIGSAISWFGTFDVEVRRDLMQEARLRAWAGKESFRGDADFYTWLHTIAKNAVRNYFRKLAHSLPPQPGEYDHPDNGHYDGPENCVIAEELVRAISANLSPKKREILDLCSLQGLTIEEAAEVLGVSRGTASSRLFHAKAEVRREAGEDG